MDGVNIIMALNTYKPLTPAEHLKLIYKCKVTMDGDKMILTDPNHIHGSNPHYEDIKEYVENIVTVKFSESEFNRFMQNYENYIDLIHGLNDPVVKDMFEKMMIYIKLMK